MSNKTQQFIINMIPGMKYSLNKVWAGGPGSQWKRKAMADDWHFYTEEAIKEFDIKPVKGKIQLDFKFLWKSRPLDSSNNAPMAKAIEDTLVREGILEDDTNTTVERVVYESTKLSKKERAALSGDIVEVSIIQLS